MLYSHHKTFKSVKLQQDASSVNMTEDAFEILENEDVEDTVLFSDANSHDYQSDSNRSSLANNKIPNYISTHRGTDQR